MGVVVTTSAVRAWSVGGALAVRDPGSTRVVYGVIVALVLLGVGLAVFAWWLLRTTRPDPEVLAPLEAIDSRQWRRLDPAGRRRLLDELRPDGAQPVNPEPLAPEPDAEFVDAPVAADVRELAPDVRPPVADDASDVEDAPTDTVVQEADPPVADGAREVEDAPTDTVVEEADPPVADDDAPDAAVEPAAKDDEPGEPAHDESAADASGDDDDWPSSDWREWDEALGLRRADDRTGGSPSS